MIKGIQHPVSAYSARRNQKSGSIQVIYDDKRIRDEEKVYEFNPDGSAKSRSCAWGFKSECPKGTFSDLLLKLPKTGEINAKMARKLALAYEASGSKQYSDVKIK